MGEVEHVPRSSDSIGVYALPVPRIRSPHRTQEQLRAESASMAPNPYVPSPAASTVAAESNRDRVVDELLVHGAKKIAIKRLITGHAKMNTQLTFELRDKKFTGAVHRRDLIRCCRSLDLGWNKEQLELIADHFQLVDSKRCVYEGLVSALHQNDPYKQAKRRAQAAARAEKKGAKAAELLDQRQAAAQRLLDERAPLSVPTSGPLTQPLATPVLVGSDWRISHKRPDRCEIGYERSRPGRRAYIDTTRDTTNFSLMPPWDNTVTSGSGSVREDVTTHGDRHFPVRQLLTPRAETGPKFNDVGLRDLRDSLCSELGLASAMTAQHIRQKTPPCLNEADPSLTQRVDSVRPVKVDMAVQADLARPQIPQLDPEPEPNSELPPDKSATTAAIVSAAESALNASDLVECHQPGSRDSMWKMSVLDQQVSLDLLAIKLFSKLPPPKNGRKHPRTPYAKVCYSHRMWKSSRAHKPTRRSRQSLSSERLRPETPEQLSRLRKEAEASKTVGNAFSDQVHLSPRTGAYVDIDSPLSPHSKPELVTRQKKRERSQLSSTSPELVESSGGSTSLSPNQSGITLPPHHGGLHKTWSTPALKASPNLIKPSATLPKAKPWYERSARPTKSPKKEWAWEWGAASCSWQLLEGPEGNSTPLSIDLYADNEHGFDSKIGAVSVSLNEITAGCESGEPMWLRIFSTTRGTRTHKWQGSADSRPEEYEDAWNLPDLKTTTHAAIGAVKVRFAAPGGQMIPCQRQKIFRSVSSVQLEEERAKQHNQTKATWTNQADLGEENDDETATTSDSE